ncbi:MAG TPA: hypothetical protein VE991_11675, partial [Acidimicrobiales bacterium]|nr:hypothetical protein [Acidimicrobiales bacterium]
MGALSTATVEAPAPAAEVAQAPIRWRVTGAFFTTISVWGAAMGLLSAATAHRPFSASPAVAALAQKALAGPPLLAAAVWALALALALTVHEAGHALMARRVGSPEVEVVLGGLHGRTAYSLDDPWSLRRVLVVLSGALAPAILLPFAWAPHLMPVAVVGALLVGINLIPMPMSDGGHLLAVAIHRLVPEESTAATLTQVV